MKIRRRTFVFGVAAVGAGPLLAKVWGPLTFVESNSRSLPVGQSIYDADVDAVTLKIDGWEARANDPTVDVGKVWLNVSSSWRVAWR